MPRAVPLLLPHADVEPEETQGPAAELGAGCGAPVPQQLVSHAMSAMDAAKNRPSSLTDDGCEGKGREEGTSEGKSKMIME